MYATKGKPTEQTKKQPSPFLLCECMFTCLTRFTQEKYDLRSPVKWTEMQFGLTDESAQLMRQLPVACGQNLPTDILKDDWPGL